MSWFFLEIAEGQAESIVQDIENMVRAFIEKVMILYLNDFWCIWEHLFVMRWKMLKAITKDLY